MSYFKLRPLIRNFKAEMLRKYGIVVTKVKWSKEQLDLMVECLEMDFNEGYETVKIGKLKVR